jgi:hypothetical protein
LRSYVDITNSKDEKETILSLNKSKLVKEPERAHLLQARGILND